MQRSRAVKIGAAVILVIALAVGLWYRRGLSLYQLESDPCDFSNVSYQVFFNGDRQSLEVSGGLAYNHIFEGVGQLNFHRAASNLIARSLCRSAGRHPGRRGAGCAAVGDDPHMGEIWI